ncbi:hypothetical protein JHN63_20050 [Streptomyces sp. MBT65]|uniref:hypothetical protein n=1 Tax=Streptomyces sp. MBT65 TaxID=1488395 RepID=UPI00190A7C90|nr:hypothetical protein [Streptomyces sp. MBT65]MBK3576068.1 hypothetical protein [Streptomyces sp. MBT65]
MKVEDSVELKEILADWRDYDDAAFRLGVFLGVFPRDQKFSSVKRMFWQDGYPLGDMLVDMLDRMAEAGVLLKNDEDVQYKWNPTAVDLS